MDERFPFGTQAPVVRYSLGKFSSYDYLVFCYVIAMYGTGEFGSTSEYLEDLRNSFLSVGVLNDQPFSALPFQAEL